ncbi:MAG: Hsp20/alpha crystallin family protein [Deltaproteobacteria bacterium]|nr:Hsp20/alpha crystallin family protein [Deltaproteobacteria bacterium]MBW1966302.1 Hsp20/alpha crystallin family protein [Deltaproteobacteria bacterium]MBW2097772.1 Hsp20/alpha crystallin family protein [Deltaproteobacteria bacterium]
MSGLTLWTNQEIKKLRRDIDFLYDRMCRDFGISKFMVLLREEPLVDIVEKKDGFVVRANLPDLDPEDLDVSVIDDQLIIRGEKREKISNKKDEIKRSRSFSSRVRLPSRVKIENIRASYKEGVLEIVLPKYRSSVSLPVKILKK